MLPPLTEAEWQAEFAKYQATPEYQKVNRGMSLAAFQRIWWMEYSHRLLGRLIGGVDFSELVWTLAEANGDQPAVVIGYGEFINAIDARQACRAWLTTETTSP